MSRWSFAQGRLINGRRYNDCHRDVAGAPRLSAGPGFIGSIIKRLEKSNSRLFLLVHLRLLAACPRAPLILAHRMAGDNTVISILVW